MSRYYSDSDDTHYVSRRQLDNVHASGWQSPLPTTDVTPSSVARIVVECPFGSKKCDYTIDKSQRGRLIVTARRRHKFKYDNLLSNNKDNIAIQTFTIPYDADVDHLTTYIEQYTNRLIIEIPRLSDILTSSTGTSQLIFNDTKSSRKSLGNNQKLEYLIDCHGYTADELDVFIQNQNLIVQGKTKRARSTDPTQEHISKKFSRKISLPNTVDLPKVISYLENGQLRIEAPLKRESYYNDNGHLLSRLPTTTIPNRTIIKHNRIQSPISNNYPYHYRPHEHVNRHHRRRYDYDDIPRPTSSMQRIYSAENLHYPLYRSWRDLDNDGDDEDDSRQNRYRQIVNNERYITNRNGTKQQPTYKSTYLPTNNVVRTTTTHRYYPTDENVILRIVKIFIANHLVTQILLINIFYIKNSILNKDK
ncbi:unnamed protein product [Rotaria sordida]|uniref:SHSP domain-containing protein n=1 Tax=Rotaria sordida TaxID=392033 RepID=A0A814S071_9BILA|nr:unnamed protein product [Rotaria sordida]